MKKINYADLRLKIWVVRFILFIGIATFFGCKKNTDLSYAVAARKVLMLDALRQDTSLSIAVAALDKANMAPTLNTYGPFTFFAPDNNAFRRYFKNKGKKGLEDFTSDDLKILMTYHILQQLIFASDFIQGPQSTATGGGDFISLDISLGYKYNTVANGIAKIYQTDIQYSNGLVHKMDGVLDPPILTIGQFISQNPDKYSIMTAGLKRAGLLDTLTALNDKSGARISLTLFAETNDVLTAAGITSFDAMPLTDLKALMLYHIVKGGNFSSNYTFFTPAIPSVNVVERYDNTILTLDNQNWIYFNLADTKLINNSTISFLASDILMKNGLVHNIDKHMVFDPATKRTQIFHFFYNEVSWGYGLPSVTSTQVPVIASTGNFIFQNTAGPARGSVNMLLAVADGVGDSVVTIVRNVRRGKYNIEINYNNNSASRGTFQLMYGQDNIGVPYAYGTSPAADQKKLLGNYEFKTSGDKRLKFVCTKVGNIKLDCMVLTPTN